MKRRLPLIFVAVVTVLCLVGATVAGVAASANNFSPVAYRVNDTKASQATVDRELAWLAGNSQIRKAAQQQGGVATDASLSSTIAASWLSQRIQTELLRQGAEAKGVTVPATTRTKLRQQFAEQFPHAPASALDILVDGNANAYLSVLGLDTDAKQGSFFQAALKKADIAVDPRYGRWNPRIGVCPPTGCAAVAGAGG